MVDRIAISSKKRFQRAVLTVALGGAFGVGLGVAIPQVAYAASESDGRTLSSNAVTTIQGQIQAAIGNVESQGLTGSALDAALSAAIARVVISDVSAYGHSGEIASVVIATGGIPAVDIGTGLGEAAVQIAKTDTRAGDAIARTVANEGAPGEPGAFATASNLAGDTQLADIATGTPEVTGSTSGGVGITFGGSTPPPPPAPAAPCSNPTCS